MLGFKLAAAIAALPCPVQYVFDPSSQPLYCLCFCQPNRFHLHHMGLIDITHVDLANHGKDITAERIAPLGSMLVIRPFRFHSSNVSGCGLIEGHGHCSGGSKGATLGQEIRRAHLPALAPDHHPQNRGARSRGRYLEGEACHSAHETKAGNGKSSYFERGKFLCFTCQPKPS